MKAGLEILVEQRQQERKHAAVEEEARRGREKEKGQAQWGTTRGMVDTAGSVKVGLHDAAERRAEEERVAAEEERVAAEEAAARRGREKEKVTQLIADSMVWLTVGVGLVGAGSMESSPN